MDYCRSPSMVMENHDVFDRKAVCDMLRNRFIVVIGDSNQRAVYKDIILLLQEDRLLSQSELRAKGEYSFLKDELIEGGRKGEMNNGVTYREVRQYQTSTHLVRFYFTTRCYNYYVETILSDLQTGPTPDVLVMNSCLWDITRYGRNSVPDYKENLETLFTRFQQSLPEDCLVIWATTLPISSSARGGFLIPEIEFLSTSLRLDILEANYYAKKVAASHGHDVLDLHFYLRHYMDCRVKDGVHWDMRAHRYITNLVLSHVCDAWGITSPAKRPSTLSSYGSVAATRRNQYSGYHGNYGYNNSYGSGNYGYDNSYGTGNYYNSSGYHSSHRGYQSEQNFHDNFMKKRHIGPPNNFKTMENNLTQTMMIANMLTTFQVQEACMSFNNVWNGPSNYQWQAYQDKEYKSTAPSRRQRADNNPYSRRRR